MRLRDLDVRLELGLQESVRSAVARRLRRRRSSRARRSRPTSPPARSPSARSRDSSRRARSRSSRAAGRARDARRPGVRRVRAGAARVIVRWGLDELPGCSPSSAVERPLARRRARAGARRSRCRGTAWAEVPVARAIDGAADGVGGGIVAVGGGSAIDPGKAVSAATGLPLVSVPTTYAGAEWTTFFGVRDPDRADARRRRRRAAGARSSTSRRSRSTCRARRPSARR